MIILSTFGSTTYNRFNIALYDVDTQRHSTPLFAFISMSITQCVDIYVVCGYHLSIGDG